MMIEFSFQVLWGTKNVFFFGIVAFLKSVSEYLMVRLLGKFPH